MTKIKTITFGIAALSIPAIAFAQLNVGDTMGTTEADITAALTAQGYTVLEIEIENDEIEAEVALDGVESEITIDIATGQILEVELDDEDDDSDDEEDDDDKAA